MKSGIACRFVKQVDRFVWQITVRDISFGKAYHFRQKRIRDLYAVVRFVILLDAFEYGDTVFDRRLVYGDGLETAFERRVRFDIFSVFAERGSADELDLTS